MEFIVLPNTLEEVFIYTSSFRNIVQRVQKARELKFKYVYSISDVLGLVRGDLIYFSYTFSTLQRLVIYVQIIIALLYSPSFLLNHFKKYQGALLVQYIIAFEVGTLRLIAIPIVDLSLLTNRSHPYILTYITLIRVITNNDSYYIEYFYYSLISQVTTY